MPDNFVAADLAQLDSLASEGRIAMINTIRVGDRWQTYIKLGRTNGYSAQCAASPSESIAKALERLLACEDYDIRHGHVVGAPAITTNAPVAATKAPAAKVSADVDDLLG